MLIIFNVLCRSPYILSVCGHTFGLLQFWQGSVCDPRHSSRQLSFHALSWRNKSGHTRQPIAIYPGSTKSQMKRRGGSCKSHITKSPVKAREQWSTVTSSLRSLPLKLARAGSSHSHFLSAPFRGQQHNWGVKRITLFFLRLDLFFLPRTCESIVIAFMTVLSELTKRDYSNAGMTIVRMWTLTVIKLLSWKHRWWVCWRQGEFGWKLRQRTFRNYKRLSYCVRPCSVFLTRPTTK